MGRNPSASSVRTFKEAAACFAAFMGLAQASHSAANLHPLEEGLLDALKSGHGLAVHYQPLVSACGQRVVGVEALARWTHPEYGPVSPVDFIAIAETAGLIHALGDWVLATACREIGRWPFLPFAVNLSPLQLCDENLAGRILGILHDEGVPPHRLQLEITENMAFGATGVASINLRLLRAAGVHIVLDDFGTGHSNLARLSQFHVDKIKIDRSFIAEIGNSTKAAALIGGIVGIAKALNIAITAEGIETEGQLDVAISAGCTELQGYLLAKPMPAAALEQYCGTHATTFPGDHHISSSDPDTYQRNKVHHGFVTTSTERAATAL